MRFSIITLFPDMVRSYTEDSLLARAISRGTIAVDFVNPRDYTDDIHHKADDTPYGGGPGMVLKAEPILRAVGALKPSNEGERRKIIIMAPRGKQFTNAIAKRWQMKYDHLVFIAGRYEGVDARIKKVLKAEEISIGPYVLSGGELPALVLLEAVARQLPGVLGDAASLEEARFGIGVPAYTRPDVVVWEERSLRVPKVLLSGNHAKISAWRSKHKKEK